MNWESQIESLLELAKKSAVEVPVAASVLSADGEVLATAVNQTIGDSDPTAHAEIVAIRKASEQLGSWRLDSCTLVVTLEPCVMCAGAIKTARIPRVVFGAWDERVGGSGSRYDILRDSRLGPEIEVISGVREQDCSSMLQNFFTEKRD